MNPKNIFYGVLAGTLPIWIFLAVNIEIKSYDFADSQMSSTYNVARGLEVANRVRTLNEATQRAVNDFVSASPTDKLVKKEALRKVLSDRKKVIRGLIETNPAVILENSFSARDRLRLPDDLKVLIEERVTRSGRLAVGHSDNFDNPKQNQTEYNLETDTELINLYSTMPLSSNSNSFLDIDGVLLDGAMALWGDGSTTTFGTVDTTTVDTTTTQTSTDYPVLVLLGDYNDSPVRPMTKQEMDSWFKSQVVPVISSSTYGKISMVPTVMDWYRFNRNALSSTGVCDPESYTSGPSKIMQALGLSTSGYKSVILFQTLPCSPVYGGMASLGPYSGGVGFATILTKTNFSSGTTVHELGHNLNLYHSSMLNCQNSAFSGTCAIYEYGNAFDRMGYGTYASHYNSSSKMARGWLPALDVNNVTQSGTYTISPLGNASGIRALAVSASDGTKYFLEYRTSTGIDSNLVNSAGGLNTQGVFLYRYKPGLSLPKFSDKYVLLDTTPNSDVPPIDFGSGSNWPNEFKDITDVTLRGQRIITDPQTGFSFGPVSTPNTAGINVVITFPGSPLPNLSSPTPGPSTSSVADATLPVVNMTSPGTGSSVSGLASLAANASDDSGIVSRVEFYFGSSLLYTDTQAPFSYSWDTSRVPDGTYSLTAKAFDPSGNNKTSPAVTVSVNNSSGSTPTTDTTPPVVRVSSPTSGSVVSFTKSSTLTAIATDNVKVSQVSFTANGFVVCANVTSQTSAFSCQWKPAERKTPYSIRATAYDSSGNQAMSSIVSVTSH